MTIIFAETPEDLIKLVEKHKNEVNAIIARMKQFLVLRIGKDKADEAYKQIVAAKNEEEYNEMSSYMFAVYGLDMEELGRFVFGSPLN